MIVRNRPNDFLQGQDIERGNRELQLNPNPRGDEGVVSASSLCYFGAIGNFFFAVTFFSITAYTDRHNHDSCQKNLGLGTLRCVPYVVESCPEAAIFAVLAIFLFVMGKSAGNTMVSLSYNQYAYPVY